MAGYDVLSYGTIGIDRVVRIPHWPHPDVSTHALAVAEHLGGKATNTGVHLAMWGLSVTVSGSVIGHDEIGDKVRRLLKRYPNIHTDALEWRRGVRSMYCLILVNPQGERAIVGINADSQSYTQPSKAMVRRTRVLTLDLYGGEERVDVARLASEAGRPVVVGDLRRADHPVLPFTTVAIASAAELRREYPGLPLADFAHSVLEKGPAGVIITDGPDPVLTIEAGGRISSTTPPEVQVIDTTGAGDAFRAGVVYGLVRGLPLVECVQYGIAAGSFAVGQEGAASTPATLRQLRSMARTLAGA